MAGTKNSIPKQKPPKDPINSAHKLAYVLTPTPSKFSRLQKKRIRILIRILRDILIHILRSILYIYLEVYVYFFYGEEQEGPFEGLGEIYLYVYLYVYLEVYM